MDAHRKNWNQGQQELREALTHPEEHPKAIELFLRQHAMVHSAQVSKSGLWSFDDEVWQDLSEETARTIRRNLEHSIAWNIWHIARIEDVTMNMLVAGGSQVAVHEGWYERMKISMRDTGNAMDGQDVAALSSTIDLDALRAYRDAVGRRTREVVRRIQPDEFKRKVEAGRLQRVLDEGAVLPEAQGLLDYWGGLSIAGLLLMPPTRHNFVHLNEAVRIKGKSQP